MDEETKADEAPEESPDASEDKSASQDSEQETDEVAPESPEVDVKKLTDDFKSLKGKVSKLEKEREELTSAAAAWQALNEAATKDPKFALEANRKLYEQGLIPKEEFERFEKGVSEKDSPDEKKAKPSDDAPETNPALEWAMRKREEEQSQERTFFIKFEEDHPEIADGTDEEVALNRAEIGAAARRFMLKGVSKAEAYDMAYSKWAGKAEEDAELRGIAKARSARATIAPAAGESSKSGSDTELTPEQLEAAKRMDLSPEDYADGLDKDSTDLDEVLGIK